MGTYKKILLISMIFTLVLLCACGEESDTPDFAEDGILVKLSARPKDIEEDIYTYTTNIEVYNDGTIKIYAEEFSKWYGEEEPEIVELKITESEIEEIKRTILDEDLYHMHENVGNKDDISGVEKRLTIYTTEGEYSIHGISPSNVKFNRVYDLIYGLKRDELASYLININDIQKKGNINDTGICIIDSNGSIIFRNSDIESINIQNMNDITDEDDTSRKDIPPYKIVIKVKEDNVERLNELTQYADEKNYVTFNLNVDNKFYMLLYTCEPIEDGKIYSNNDYTMEEAEETVNELVSELE
ncbi:MAG: hypothetical protein IJ763_05025 [Lachnospiraceae bacterium]|nr:hypothetical protein [Lachnospiraceae bacterium]